MSHSQRSFPPLLVLKAVQNGGIILLSVLALIDDRMVGTVVRKVGTLEKITIVRSMVYFL